MTTNGLSTLEATGLSWEREDTHWPDRLSRWAAELYMTRQSRGIAEVCDDAGLLFEGVRTAEVDGWAYMAVVPLGGRPRKPPPNWLMPLLVRVVPDLRKRIATMRRLDRADYWRSVVDDWLAEDEAALLAEGHRFLDTDLSELDDEALADLTDRAWEFAERAVKKHFHLHGAGISEIMRLSMELNRNHGFTTAELSGLLTGLSDTTTGPAEAQAEIIQLIRDAGGEDTLLAAATVDDLRPISEDVDAALTRYLGSWGRRALRYEVAYPTIAETPGQLVELLRAQFRRPSPSARAADHAELRTDVERRVLAALGDTAATRDRIERARQAFPIREGNETATVALPAAALRSLGLEAGRRLTSTGHLKEPAHVFDALPSEVDAVLRSRPVADLAATAAARHAARTAPVDERPPMRIGPEPVLPDVSAFPDDIRESVEAVLWFSSKAATVKTGIPDADDQPTTDAAVTSAVSGLGVAPGTYEGVARVVLDESGFDRIEPGDVLVCPITSPIWSMVFPLVGALVCDSGGPLSHPAIIAREFGIPAVVGTEDATTRLEDGARIRVDGSSGAVELVG